MHIQDRGNDSMPEDLVKILKTQDENYVRTIRAAGLKVSFECNVSYCNSCEIIRK